MTAIEVGVSLDRVTVVGELSVDRTFASWLHELGFEAQVRDGVEQYVLRRYYGDADGDYENLIFLMPVPYSEHKWRFDTSNHLSADERAVAGRVARCMLGDVHLSRSDIAFDFRDGPAPLMSHVILRSRATEAAFFRDGLGRPDTVYSGKRGSTRMIRLYDKRREQIVHKKTKLIDGVTCDELGSPLPAKWERWEVQLRHDRARSWYEEAKEMLSFIKLPVIAGSSLSPMEKAMCHALSDGTIAFGDLSTRTRSKYRKLMQESDAFDDSYARAALEALELGKGRIEQEIKVFLGELLS